MSTRVTRVSLYNLTHSEGEPMQRHLKQDPVPIMTQSMDEIRKQAIVDALTGFTEEMKLIDVVDLVAYVRMERHGNIAELVSSAAELFFRKGTLKYAMSAAIDLDWGQPPEISLNLEFFNSGVWVYFTLVLAEPENRVNVDYIEITQGQDKSDLTIDIPDLPALDADILTKRLLNALIDAEVRPD